VSRTNRFTKISADGKKLKATAKTWAAVLDNTTGLIWDVGEYAAMNWSDAKAHVKQMRTAGFKKWRLPSVQELVAILDYSRAGPAIDTKAFPNCKSDWYWTGTIDVSFPSGFAWVVNLRVGVVFRGYQAGRSFVRAVRAGQLSDFGIRKSKATS
jgi:hypothetical protein